MINNNPKPDKRARKTIYWAGHEYNLVRQGARMQQFESNGFMGNTGWVLAACKKIHGNRKLN